MSSSSTHPNNKHLDKDQNLVQDAMLLSQIGLGFVGARLYRAQEKDRIESITVKIVDFQNNVECVDMSREGAISVKLIHENIIRTHKYYTKENCLIMHMEYLVGTNLRGYILERGHIDVAQAQRITDAVYQAVEYMHSNNITHGDIHQGNVMMDEIGRIKLIDFGCARKHSNSSEFMRECRRRDTEQLKRLGDVLLKDELKYILEY